jgi:hypothetical protein
VLSLSAEMFVQHTNQGTWLIRPSTFGGDTQ